MLYHYPCLFNRTTSCVWQCPVYLSVSASVSAEGVVKLSALVSVSAESQFMTFGRVSVSAETRNSLSVGLYSKLYIFLYINKKNSGDDILNPVLRTSFC